MMISFVVVVIVWSQPTKLYPVSDGTTGYDTTWLASTSIVLIIVSFNPLKVTWYLLGFVWGVHPIKNKPNNRYLVVGVLTNVQKTK